MRAPNYWIFLFSPRGRVLCPTEQPSIFSTPTVWSVLHWLGSCLRKLWGHWYTKHMFSFEKAEMTAHPRATGTLNPYFLCEKQIHRSKNVRNTVLDFCENMTSSSHWFLQGWSQSIKFLLDLHHDSWFAYTAVIWSLELQFSPKPNSQMADKSLCSCFHNLSSSLKIKLAFENATRELSQHFQLLFSPTFFLQNCSVHSTPNYKQHWLPLNCNP